MPFQRGPNSMMGLPGGPPGPTRSMRPGFSPKSHPPFFNNNFMQSRPLLRLGMTPIAEASMPAYVAAPIMSDSGPAMPRKILINPNFKGGVEAVKNQLIKDQFFSSGSSSDYELLRKQQEFINHNMRQIEKRRYEWTPSPEYRRGYSHSLSPPRYRRTNRRKPFKKFDRKRLGRKDLGGEEGKVKDEIQPEEDDETRAYRQQIESQRKKREEILKKKEMRRRQQAEQKAKETQHAEQLQPIVVTDKKIVLKRKLENSGEVIDPANEADRPQTFEKSYRDVTDVRNQTDVDLLETPELAKSQIRKHSCVMV